MTKSSQDTSLMLASCGQDPSSSNHETRPLWEILVQIGASVPEEDWRSVPTDLAENLDHYLYGAAKDDCS